MFDIALCQAGAYFKNLRARLDASGVSANQLAAACVPPMAPSQLSRWMRGRIDPLLSSVGRLETSYLKLTAAKRGE